MKRGMEAFMILYLALYHFYLKDVDELLDNAGFDIIQSEIKELTSFPATEFKKKYNKLTETVNECNLLSKCNDADKLLKNQGQFLRNYMLMYEALLLFVRSSRMGNWDLHLQALENFVKYFFAHDQLNYARMTPLYLANMEDLEVNDRESWEYLKENFSICKSPIPFTAIGSDHAMEQVYYPMITKKQTPC